MHLPDPPFISHFLVENPWPVSLAAAAVALVLFALARRRGNGRLLSVAAIFLLLAVGVQALARVVVTQREQLIAATQELLNTTAPLNASAFKQMLDARFSIVLEDGQPWLDGQTVVTQLERAAGKFTIQKQVILAVEAENRGENAGRTLVDVRTEGSGGQVTTRWLISWVRATGDPWVVLNMQWLDSPRVGGLRADPGMLR